MKAKVISLLLGVYVMISCLVFFSYVRGRSRLIENTEILWGVADAFESKITHAITYAEILAATVRFSNDDAMLLEEFEVIGTLAKDANICVSSIQLAPDCVVSSIYPLEGNETAIGHDILADEERREFVLQAIRSDKTIVQGPMESKQGGSMLFARRAVVDEEGLWGLVIVAIDFEQLMQVCIPDFIDRELAVDFVDAEQETEEHLHSRRTLALYAEVPSTQIKVRVSMPEEKLVMPGLWYILIAVALGLAVCILTNHVARKIRESREDPLTGTLGKRAFQGMVKSYLNRERGFGSLCTMDLDRFKEINDTYGHLVGDAVLACVADRIRRVVRKGDLVSRIGGDEYMILLKQVSEEETDTILERIRIEVQEDMLLDGVTVSVGCSLGCAQFPQEGMDYNRLYRLADRRMYQDKKDCHAGR